MATYLGRFAVLTALAHFALELCINFLPVVYPTLITSMGLTYAQIGFIALVASLCGSLTQPLFGYLSDRWGPNRIVIMSIAWSGLIMGLVGFTGTYAVLILLVGLGALGSAAFHPAGAVLASVTASKRRGTAISVFSVGGNLGAALSPLWVAAGISWLGLGGTIVITPIALIVTFALYRHLKQHTGLVDDRLKANREQARPQARTNNTPLITGLALIILVVMSRTWFQVSLMTYLPEWIRSQGQSLTFGGQVLAVFMFAISVGSLTGGSLSDYLGRWQVVASSLAILGLVP